MSIAWIDGRPWRVCLPTGGKNSHWKGDDWDRRLRILGEDNDLLHWKTIQTWCRNLGPQLALVDYRVIRGNVSPRYWYCLHQGIKNEGVGFRPDLVPLNPQTMELDQTIISGYADGTKLVFGSLYMDSKALQIPLIPTSDGDVPDYQECAELHIGDSDPDLQKQICWIKCGDRLFSDRVLIKRISWFDLERNGFTVEPETKQKPTGRKTVGQRRK